ncbi:DUF748 domain-containing protein [Paraburkholderia gardini]|uniref:DUF748 domain-containing protein n=1 Tax=Paraburkholderia gardini TaxID=2823469 RepID=A0ABM8U6F1_9BURK|nr:DUF748 domain-containing protein [Paraburkholderia gardini]CAG4908416.1 hypothetical protein R54767_03506 [Paraburkholderia gardini]
MPMSKGSRVVVALTGVAAILVVIVLAGLLFIQHEVKERIAAALGPRGSADTIDVGFKTIRLTNVRLRAPDGWPAADPFRADTVVLEPDLRDLIQRRIHMRNVVVSGFNMTVLRTKDGGVQLLPNLRQTLNSPANTGASDASASEASSLPLEKIVDHIEFQHGTFVFYDLTVSNPAYRISITDASATIDHIHVPDLDEPTTLAINGSIKGPSHTGTVSFGGWIKIASKDSQTTTTLRGVDIRTLDPYLLRKAGARAQVTDGTLDMKVDSTVHNYQLHAPGVITVHHLQLADSGSPVDTFLSIPTKAAVAALKKHGDDITLHFVLEGNLRDPKFSLNESLLTKMSNGFAEALGVSVAGVAKGAGETVKGLGNALLNLIGKEPADTSHPPRSSP